MEKVHRAEDYFRKVIYDKLHFHYICCNQVGFI